MTAYRIIIPARYASSRLPGKPLLPLAGKPMLQWVWERARGTDAESITVATDDPRVEAAARAFGADVCMTSPTHESGTDRLAEVCRTRAWLGRDIIVNLQGDEPVMPASLLRSVATALDTQPDVGIATLATPVETVDDLFDPNIVKVVRDGRGLGMYFSRAPIPWSRAQFAGTGRPSELPDGVPYLRHLGLYAYRAETLLQVSAAPPHPVEQVEALEQLRALALGVRIHVGVVDEPPGHGVDTPADLARVEALLSVQQDD